MLSDISLFEPVSAELSSAQFRNTPVFRFISGQVKIQSWLLACTKNGSPQPLIVAGGSGNLALSLMLSQLDSVYCVNGKMLSALTQNALDVVARSLPQKATMVVIDCADQADQSGLVELVGHIMHKGAAVALLVPQKHRLAPILTVQAKTVFLILEKLCLS